MDADLTCHCQRDGFVRRDLGEGCFTCAGSGRRRPTLAEWDALRAERDRCYSALMDAAWALERITSQSPRVLRLPHWIGADLAECDRALEAARAALDAKEGRQ